MQLKEEEKQPKNVWELLTLRAEDKMNRHITGTVKKLLITPLLIGERRHAV